jgi:DNA-binding transcriptional MerR regulator
MIDKENSTVEREGFSNGQESGATMPRVSVQNASDNSKSRDAFRTISEVADTLGVQQHVLRFWETKFSQIRPLKRGGGRRYYRPEDMELLKTIQHLLYSEGYTIKGVQKLLRTQGKKTVMKQALPAPQNSNEQGRLLQKKPAPQQPAQPLIASRPPQPSSTEAVSLDRDGSGLNSRQEQALAAMLDELRALRSFVAGDVQGQ